MQTFLPYPSYQLSAECLDNKRLGKQRVEAWQILRALRGETKGWVNHPATVMWRGYEQALIQYGVTMCIEWRKRGFQDSLLKQFIDEQRTEFCEMPWWFGWRPFHISHMSNLLRKDPIHYAEFLQYTNATMPYVWCKPDGSYTGIDHTTAEKLLPPY